MVLPGTVVNDTNATNGTNDFYYTIYRRLVTLAEHASDHGIQTNTNTKEWGEKNWKTTKELLLKTFRLKLKLKLSRLVL